MSVTVENFRSITAARKIPIANLTTLVGPNNEGKSNILRALVIGMNLLVQRRLGAPRFRRPILRRHSHDRVNPYNWAQDYPLKMQKREPPGGSAITLEFELTDDDISDFGSTLGSKINGTLPISFILHKDELRVSIAKPGRGHKTLNSKAPRIADFIADRIGIQYIPAVRTAEFAQGIVSDLVREELGKVEDDSKYKQALTDIAAIQEPILKDISEKITATMREFLPNITSAKIVIQEADRSYALRDISALMLDDGVETPLTSKGDGVQSLAALALMRHSSQLAHEGKEIVIALEEPESHLHPSAIRQLRNVLNELSDRHQVVLTTHNPIFTNRLDIQQNIIVNQNRAYPAKTVKEVRDVLGVRLDDNLSSAEVISRCASILRSMDAILDKNLRVGQLGIDVLGGATNLSHRIRLHTEAVGKVQVFLDDDQAGRQAFKAATRDGLVDTNDVNFTMVGGKSEAELEDLYDQSVYDDIIKLEVGLPWGARGADGNKKWAERLKNLLRQAGKPHEDGTIQIIKIKVAQAAGALGVKAIHPSKSGPIDSLKTALLQKLGDP